MRWRCTHRPGPAGTQLRDLAEQWVGGKGFLVLARQGLAQRSSDVVLVAQLVGELSVRPRPVSSQLVADLAWQWYRVRLDRAWVERARALLVRAGLGAAGRSWAPQPAGCRVPTWRGSRAWLRQVSRLLQTQDAAAVLRRRGAAAPAVLRVARADAASADPRTGRNVTTAHATVARRLGLSEVTVRKARYVLADLGLATTVVAGRYLTQDEVRQAHEYHGGHQTRIASTRALTHPPRRVPPRSNHLSQRDSVCTSKSRLVSSSPARARARGAEFSMPVRRLAARLVSQWPLLQGQRPSRVCSVLQRLGLDADGWTCQDLINAVTALNRQRGWAQPDHVRSPIGLFAVQVRDATRSTTIPPVQRRAQELAARRTAAEPVVARSRPATPPGVSLYQHLVASRRHPAPPASAATPVRPADQPSRWQRYRQQHPEPDPAPQRQARPAPRPSQPSRWQQYQQQRQAMRALTDREGNNF